MFLAQFAFHTDNCRMADRKQLNDNLAVPGIDRIFRNGIFQSGCIAEMICQRGMRHIHFPSDCANGNVRPQVQADFQDTFFNIFAVTAHFLHTFMLTNWLGRMGSNHRMTVSKTVALPLGYAPSSQTPYDRLNIVRASSKTGEPARVPHDFMKLGLRYSTFIAWRHMPTGRLDFERGEHAKG